MPAKQVLDLLGGSIHFGLRVEKPAKSLNGTIPPHHPGLLGLRHCSAGFSSHTPMLLASMIRFLGARTLQTFMLGRDPAASRLVLKNCWNLCEVGVRQHVNYQFASGGYSCNIPKTAGERAILGGF